MIDDLLEKPQGPEILRAILECNRRALLRTDAERERLMRKYPGSGKSRTLVTLVCGFGWEEPAQELISRGIYANPEMALRQLRRRGLLAEIPGKAPKYYLPHPQVIEEGLQRRDADVKNKWQGRPLSPSAQGEVREIEKMDEEFNSYIRDLCVRRLDEAVSAGKKFSITDISDYFKGMFPLLYFDSLLSVAHQYALADVEIQAPTGKVTNYTGFNLSFFGPTGSGKTFSIDDIIRGNRRMGVPAHGLPGRNRYCGGITPIQFIRIGEAYTGRKFNFIVPEFNDFFRYKGMVEPLKLVMEQREVKYETTEGTIGPYLFSSFFSVNYNTRVFGNSYVVTIADPNFEAIEDRMLCRLHRMSKERFSAIDESRMRLELGELDFKMAGQIRDHLALVYAIQTRHPLLSGKFPYKPVVVDRKIYDRFSDLNASILDELDRVTFSTRLGSRAIRLACAMSLVDYFCSDRSTISLNPDAVDFAVRFYIEEIASRSHGRLPVDKILKKAGVAK